MKADASKLHVNIETTLNGQPMGRHPFLVRLKDWQDDPSTGSGSSPETRHYFCFAPDESEALRMAKRVHAPGEHCNRFEYTVKTPVALDGVYML